MGSIEPKDVVPGPEPEKPCFHLERLEAALIVLLLVLIAVGNIIPRLLPGHANHPITIRHDSKNATLIPIDWSATPVPPTVIRHDLNTATRADLIDLPGVGPSLADSILAYRGEHGPFQKVEDLDLVTGVGPRKLESIRRFLTVAETRDKTPADPVPATGPSPVDLSAPRPSLSTLPVAGVSRLNLNTATLEQLIRLPGIGEVFGKQILERREQLGRFRSWEDVASVPGIGPKRLENIQRYATIP